MKNHVFKTAIARRIVKLKILFDDISNFQLLLVFIKYYNSKKFILNYLNIL